MNSLILWLYNYNIQFFMRLSKEDVIDVVQDFFINKRMHKPLNNTIVTLIPKTSETKHVKDYRPTSCCYTLCKVISKILPARLGRVIGSIVQGNQSAFVPGHCLHEHIMLAYELIRGYTRKDSTPRCMMHIDLQKAYDTID